MAGLLFAFVMGMAWPQPGRELNGYSLVPVLLISFIFYVQGLFLSLADVGLAARAWRPLLAGLVCVLAATPWAGAAVLRLELGPQELNFGLALFACMPCTLTSGVVLVERARGNVALAIFLTVSASMLSTVTIPVVLPAVLSTGSLSADLSIDPVPLLVRLLLLVLVPLLAGMACRSVRPFLQWAERHRTLLRSAALAGLICIPWMKVSAASERMPEVGVARLALVLLVGVLLHVVFLVASAAAALAGAPASDRGSRVAVLIMGSEKTMGVLLTVLTLIEDDIGDLSPGLAFVPVVMAHLSQILIDAVIAQRFADKAVGGGAVEVEPGEIELMPEAAVAGASDEARAPGAVEV